MHISSPILGVLCVAVAGCSSLHPLQEDVTRVNTYEIVKKIRCEARSAVIEQGVVKKDTLEDDVRDRRGKIDKKRVAFEKVLKPLKSKYEAAINVYGIWKPCFAEDAYKTYRREVAKCKGADLLDCIERARKKHPISCAKEDKIVNEFVSKVEEVIVFKKSLSVDDGTLTLLDPPAARLPYIPQSPSVYAEESAEERVLKLFVDAPVAAKDQKRSEDPFSVAESNYIAIISEARTDFLRFTHQTLSLLLYPNIRDTAIAYEFKFTINEGMDGSASSSFLFPFSNGKFGIDFSFGEDKDRQSERGFDISEYFTELVYDQDLIGNCHGDVPQIYDEKYPITGSIGLSEVINTYINLAYIGKFGSGGAKAAGKSDKDEKKSGQGDVTNFTDVLTFTTIRSGSMRSALDVNPVPHDFRLVKATGAVGADRKDVHKVGILLSTRKGDLDPKDQVQRRLDDRKRLDDLREALTR